MEQKAFDTGISHLWLSCSGCTAAAEVPQRVLVLDAPKRLDGDQLPGLVRAVVTESASSLTVPLYLDFKDSLRGSAVEFGTI